MRKQQAPEIREAVNRAFIQGHLLQRGWMTYTPAADHGGVDLLAMHLRSGGIIKVQQKSVLTINKNLVGLDLWIGVRQGDAVILVPHDVLIKTKEGVQAKKTYSWRSAGEYSWPRPSKRLLEALGPYTVK